MKHLLTAIACCLAVAGSAQTCPEDLNGDGVIGTVDLLQLLNFYGEFCPEEPEEDYTLQWALNRDACKVNWGGGGNYEIGINCQYVFVAIPNDGGGSGNLRLPNELPFDEYSIHVHVNKAGVIACGTNGTSCPTIQVQKFESGSWADFDDINPNNFFSSSGLAVQHRTYTFLDGTWTILADNYQTIFPE